MFEYFDFFMDGCYDVFVHLVSFPAFGAFFIVGVLCALFALILSFFPGVRR